MVEIIDKNWGRMTMTFDEKTGLPLKVGYEGISPTGPPVPAEDVYGDWREVSGIRLPHEIQLFQRGKQATSIKAREIKINTGVKAEEISRRP
jgi:hypothetical protein